MLSTTRCMLAIDLKRCVFSWSYIASLIGFILVKLPGMWYDLLQYQGADVLYYFYYAPTQGIALTGCVFCALPCSRLLMREFEDKFYRSAMIRSGRAPYIASKCITLIITPVSLVFLSELLFVGVLSILCPLVDPDALCQSYNNLTRVLTFGPLLEHSFWTFFGAMVSLEALSGVLFTLLAVITSMMVRSSYSVVAAPFLIKYYLHMLLSFVQMPPALNIYYVESGQYAIGSAGMSLLYGISFFLVLIAFAVLGLDRIVRRKICDD